MADKPKATEEFLLADNFEVLWLPESDMFQIIATASQDGGPRLSGHSVLPPLLVTPDAVDDLLEALEDERNVRIDELLENDGPAGH